MANTKITSNVISDDIALGGNPTTTTQSAGNDTTRIATTAFVKAAIDATIDSAPGALDTLNELAAAIGDDANFSTTITNSIATKLPLAGGTLTGNLTVPYLATTSYIDLNNSGNRGKIGWSGNHTYIATTSSVGSIIFKNNVGSTDAPQTGGDTLLTLADDGNATFAGTISSGAITSTGDVEVRSGNKLILQRPNNGVASNISTDSTGAMILDSLNTEGFFFNNNGTNAFKLDPVNATFAGSIAVAQSSAPTEALEVNGSIVCSNFTDEEGIFFRSGFSNTNKYNVSIMAKDHNGSSADGLSINGYDGISFCTGSNSRNEVVRITGGTSNTGDVLIGTLVNPVGTGLAVNAAINTSSTTAIEIQQATNGANKAAAALGLAIVNGGESTNAADLLFHTASGGSISEAMRITSNGTLAPRHESGQGYLSFTHVKGGGNHINVKTNIYRASKMYMLKILGHISYSGERIDTIITGYAYAPNQGQTASTYHGITNHGTVGIAVYYSSDDYLCFRTTAAGSYNSIDIIGSSGANGYYQGGPIEILAYTSIAGTGNHYA